MADPRAHTARLDAIVRQHAETSALMGVGFVPVYRTGNPSDLGQLAEPKPRIDKAEIESASPQDRLDGLCEKYTADSPHSAFETDHTSIVFGEGDPCAQLMFIGEAPGGDEDREGRPFVGKSGQLLDKMIVAMGLSRGSVYIANVLKTRPPGNRTPTLEEARLCAPYLFEQIRIINPEVIVTLGKSAGQLLLGTDSTMGKMHGQWAVFPPPAPIVPAQGFVPIAVMPTYHPAYLLRDYSKENRAMVWSDLKQVMQRLGLDG